MNDTEAGFSPQSSTKAKDYASRSTDFSAIIHSTNTKQMDEKFSSHTNESDAPQGDASHAEQEPKNSLRTKKWVTNAPEDEASLKDVEKKIAAINTKTIGIVAQKAIEMSGGQAAPEGASSAERLANAKEWMNHFKERASPTSLFGRVGFIADMFHHVFPVMLEQKAFLFDTIRLCKANGIDIAEDPEKDFQRRADERKTKEQTFDKSGLGQTLQWIPFTWLRNWIRDEYIRDPQPSGKGFASDLEWKAYKLHDLYEKVHAKKPDLAYETFIKDLSASIRQKNDGQSLRFGEFVRLAEKYVKEEYKF